MHPETASEMGSKEQLVEQGDKRHKRIQRLADIQQSGDIREKDTTHVSKESGTTLTGDSETTLSDYNDNDNVANEGHDGEEVDTTHRPEGRKETRLESDTSSIIKSSELHQLVGTPERTNPASCVDTATSFPSETLRGSDSLPFTPPNPPTQQQTPTTTTSTHTTHIIPQ